MTKAHDDSLSAYWFSTLRELEEGTFPDLEVLAINLRASDAVPAQARIWLADFVAGKVKRPKGAPQRSNWYDTMITGNWIRGKYYAHLERITEDREAVTAWRKEGVRDSTQWSETPSEEALQRTFDELRVEGEAMSIESIRDVIKRRGRWK